MKMKSMWACGLVTAMFMLFLFTGAAQANGDTCGDVMPSVNPVGLDSTHNTVNENTRYRNSDNEIHANFKTSVSEVKGLNACTSCHTSSPGGEQLTKKKKKPYSKRYADLGGSNTMMQANTNSADPMALMGTADKGPRGRGVKVPLINGMAVVPAGVRTSTLRFIYPGLGNKQRSLS